MRVHLATITTGEGVNVCRLNVLPLQLYKLHHSGTGTSRDSTIGQTCQTALWVSTVLVCITIR